MRFPTNTDVTALRQRADNRSLFYLAVQKGNERVAACGIHGGAGTIYLGCHYELGNTDVYDNNEHSLTFGTAGILAATDIRTGMTIACGTLADPFLYGSARIRLVDAVNDILYLEPNNISIEGHFVAGEYIWVDGVYRLYRKLPHIVSGVVYEDGNPDTALVAGGIPGYGVAFATNYLDRPIALMGSPRVAWTDQPINLYGWRSHGRGGNTITTYLWDLDGGVAGGAGVNAAGTPANPVTGRWNTAGEYTLRLTVTDNSGKVGNDAYGVPYTQHTAVRPVLVYNRPGAAANTPYTEFEVNSLGGQYGSGWRFGVTVYGTADKTEFPDNALVILFCEDWWGGERALRGGWYGQENILFIGHILADSVKVDSEQSTVTFTAQTIEQWAKEIDCWPCNFEADAAPSAWHQFANMTCEDILWFLAEFRSTLKDITDCFFASDIGTEKQVDFLDLTEAMLYDQMSDQVGSCFFGQMSASRHSSLHLSKHKNMLDLVERTVFGPPVWVFSTTDWRDEVEVGEERQRDSIAQIDFIGFIYNANGDPQDVYSLSPPNQSNFGRIEKVTGVLLTGNTIAAAQPEANTLSGLYRAWKNIRFPHVRVPAFNNRFLEPATQDYFAIELAAADTVRGFVWPQKEFLTLGVNYEINQERGYVLADITGEASTWGPDGVAGEYPERLPSPPDDNPPEYFDVWPSGDPPTDPDGVPWADPTEGPDSWEPAAGAWQNDGGPTDVFQFFVLDNKTFCWARCSDYCSGLYERTGPATWTRRTITPGSIGPLSICKWMGIFWCIENGRVYYSVNGSNWVLDYGPAGALEDFRWINGYGPHLYILRGEIVVGPGFDVAHFDKRDTTGNWTPDAISSTGYVSIYDMIPFGGYVFWSRDAMPPDLLRGSGGTWETDPDDLGGAYFEVWRSLLYANSDTLGDIYERATSWYLDYEYGGVAARVSVGLGDNHIWICANPGGGNVQVHTRWWGYSWQSILPTFADSPGTAAIMGADGFVYAGGATNIWRFVPA